MGPGVVDEHLLACLVRLAHGAFEPFGKLAVALAELEVAQGFEGRLLAVFIADLGAVLLPQQHEGDAFAAQLLMHLPVVRAGESAGLGDAEQSTLQIGLANRSGSWPRWWASPAQRCWQGRRTW